MGRAAADTSIQTYRSKRDFTVTGEPAPEPSRAGSPAPIFVVQKHHARRAGLHWDFRLEHGGVLWSWAVPKGPSLDPEDRRVAIHVEDHPIDYATFQGTIPDGQYGAGAVETWDTGTWQPLEDPEAGMRAGNLRFVLRGKRLSGRFTLARLGGRGGRKQEGWFLIKGHDEAARPGADAVSLESEHAAPAPPSSGKRQARTSKPPAAGAVRGMLPDTQAPQLCSVAENPPEGGAWVTEIKFDGYRILASVQDGQVRLLTRNGLDWADRMPAIASAVSGLGVRSATLDGELVALRPDGVSSFPDLQAALKAGRDDRLFFFAFDLLHLDGWDLRRCTLLERKRVLVGLGPWGGMLRYSDHHEGQSAEMRRSACRMGLEGIICKQADAPYQPGRGRGWLKVKCSGREELIVLGWTPPAGSRVGIGALHLGYRDPAGQLHYAGGVGTGFSDAVLSDLRARLDGMQAPPPKAMLVAGDPVDRTVTWVRPELVAEVQFTGWSGAGRVRHGVYLGMREDKSAAQVVRDVADPEAERSVFAARASSATVVKAPKWHGAVPPLRLPAAAALVVPPSTSARIVTAKAPRKKAEVVGGVELTHADRQLWPGVSKRDLAEYWQAVAGVALGALAHRPLSILRCPDGVGKETFFQKNGHGIMPAAVRDGTALKQPYIAIADVEGLISLAQMSTIELHSWGSTESDPNRPDRLVLDLDPGEGVPWAEVIQAAHDVRKRLERLGLASLCRTTGGKGLHVVVPLVPDADWTVAKPFCRAFAEAMAADCPDRYVAHLKIADRRGRILVDWLRNGLGATAVSSFSPRARPGAHVAMPVAWREVTAKLDPAAFTVRTAPGLLARRKSDPWAGFEAAAVKLPHLGSAPVGAVRSAAPVQAAAASSSRPAIIVRAARPKRR